MMLGIFPKDFSQVATSQGYFPKWQLPKGIFPSGNFPSVQFLKRQLPKSVLASVLGPQLFLAAALAALDHPSRCARPPLQPATSQRA